MLGITGMLARHNRLLKKKATGGKITPNSKKTYVEGVTFKSGKLAADFLGISRTLLDRRVKSDEFDYHFITD